MPLNVERYINIFLSTNLLKAAATWCPGRGIKGHYFASFDMKDHQEVTHINIDKMDTIHAQLVTAILQLRRYNAQDDQGRGYAASLCRSFRFALELWDSGTSRFARSSDTLQLARRN